MNFFKQIFWDIGAFIIPTVDIKFVMDNNGKWICDSEDKNYSYYWIGEEPSRYKVKVQRNTVNYKYFAI